MPYGIEIQLPTDVIEAINEQAQQTPKLMATAYKRATSRLKSRWLTALRKEPPTADNYYPLPYKSEKQRRKVQALRRERGGGPYVRSHLLRDSWDVEFDTFEDGGSVTVMNDAPEARFVIGEDRQPMFEKIPWLEPNDVNSDFLDEAEDVLIETYFTVADPFAGVPE